MGGYKRTTILGTIFLLAIVGISGIAIGNLYETAFSEQRARLVETAQSQARLIEAVARFDAQFSQYDHPKGAAAATISRIRDAYANFRGFGETGELLLARRQGNEIVFLWTHRHLGLEKPEPIPFHSSVAEPTRRALLGQSGTMVGLDYRGETVLAAHEPVAALDLGIVAKIDLAEIRAPFIKAGVLVSAVALATVIVGTTLFFLVAALQDITQTVEDERLLKHAEKMESLGSLAGGIAHDFNNMLLPIISLTNMTLKSLPEDSRERLRLEKVIEASTRARKLVDRILAFSHQEDALRESLDICVTIRKAMDLLRSTLPTTIKIEEHLDRNTGTVFADHGQMDSVLVNLATNAADAMDGKTGKMTVSLSPVQVDKRKARSIPNVHEGIYARLVVKDNGHGMDGKTLERAMEPFFTTKPVGEGTGLGLSAVHGIVSKHGGGVHISSAPGKGTMVEVYLPLVEKTTVH